MQRKSPRSSKNSQELKQLEPLNGPYVNFGSAVAELLHLGVLRRFPKGAKRFHGRKLKYGEASTIVGSLKYFNVPGTTHDVLATEVLRARAYRGSVFRPHLRFGDFYLDNQVRRHWVFLTGRDIDYALKINS